MDKIIDKIFDLSENKECKNLLEMISILERKISKWEDKISKK